MIYVVNYSGDSRGETKEYFEWCTIFGTRKEAIKCAKALCNEQNKRLKYVPLDSEEHYTDYDATNYICVQQSLHWSNGA